MDTAKQRPTNAERIQFEHTGDGTNFGERPDPVESRDSLGVVAYNDPPEPAPDVVVYDNECVWGDDGGAPGPELLEWDVDDRFAASVNAGDITVLSMGSHEGVDRLVNMLESWFGPIPDLDVED